MGTIYILENKINKKYYVGQTIQTFKKRLRTHKNRNTYIGNALRKYGIDNFKITLLENILKEQLNKLEIKYIKEYNSIFPNGYNLTSGGNAGKMTEVTIKKMKEKRYTEETKKKMSEAHKGEKNHNFGKHLSIETRKKISEANKGNKPTIGMTGKHLSLETRKKMSDVQKGRISTFKGKHHTEEARKKVSVAQKGRKKTEEHKRKIGEAQIGRISWNKGLIGYGKGRKITKPRSKEFIEKQIKSHKGIPWSDSRRIAQICRQCFNPVTLDWVGSI